MLFTCKLHVINGLKRMDFPHVKRIHPHTGNSCYFCHIEAEFELFYSSSIDRLIRKKMELI
jgi:hypothetical protein